MYCIIMITQFLYRLAPLQCDNPTSTAQQFIGLTAVASGTSGPLLGATCRQPSHSQQRCDLTEMVESFIYLFVYLFVCLVDRDSVLLLSCTRVS